MSTTVITPEHFFTVYAVKKLAPLQATVSVWRPVDVFFGREMLHAGWWTVRRCAAASESSDCAIMSTNSTCAFLREAARRAW